MLRRRTANSATKAAKGVARRHAGIVPTLRAPARFEPSEVAALCAYLVGPKGSFITGQMLAINGGEYMP
jgi:NAD(P)-dependent dehydrogenase (short-subunit alcohol dehydrogenase family)